MKKFLFAMFTILTVVGMVHAAAWTAPTAYPVAINITLSKAVYPTDSLTGTDSNTIWSNISIDPTATYALRTLDSVSSGDSVGIAIRVYTDAGILVYAGDADVISASTTYKISELPINKTVFGSVMTIKAIGKVAAKVKKIRLATLLRVSPVEPNKSQFWR